MKRSICIQDFQKRVVDCNGLLVFSIVFAIPTTASCASTTCSYAALTKAYQNDRIGSSSACQCGRADTVVTQVQALILPQSRMESPQRTRAALDVFQAQLRMPSFPRHCNAVLTAHKGFDNNGN